MGLHRQRTHPIDVPGCFGCRAESVQFRTGPSAQTVSEKTLTKDLSAYRSLRLQGLQPRTIDGAADLADRASTAFEIETGRLHPRLTDADVREAKDVAAAVAPVVGA